MNVIYITFNGLTDPLGKSQVLPYLEGLSRKGVKFYLISLEKNITEAKKLSENIKEFGITWYCLKYFRYYWLGMAINIFQCFWLVLYLIVFKRVKTIHSRAYPPIFSVFLLKRIFGIKLIFDMRGFWPEGLVDCGRIRKESFHFKVLKFLEKQSILSSDVIVTLTPEAKQIIEEQYITKKLKIIWMPTCVDEDIFLAKKHTHSSKDFVMVYSGSLWSYYNVPAMIDFFISLKVKINNAHFLILGNNGIEKLNELFLEKKVNKNDYTIVNAETRDVSKYLVRGNVAICFIYDLYFSKAAFPTKLSEYLINGLPVVMNTQSNYIKDFINSNKIGVVLDNFDKLSIEKSVDSLLVLLEDKELKERCAAIAKKYLIKKVCIEKYYDIYKGL